MIHETGAPLVAVACAEGVTMLVREGTADVDMVHEVFRDRYYTCDGWDLPAGGAVLDIGAAIGTFAVEAAEAGAAVVHSYEPIPESFGVLTRNVSPYPAVHPVNAAVAVESGGVTMTGFLDLDGRVHTGSPEIGDRAAPGLPVLAVGIHDALALEPRWDVVKLDIEGYEYALIEAMTADEFTRIGSIVMEFHHHGDEADTLSRGEYLADILRGHGFDDIEVAWAWGQQGRLRARRAT